MHVEAAQSTKLEASSWQAVQCSILSQIDGLEPVTRAKLPRLGLLLLCLDEGC